MHLYMFQFYNSLVVILPTEPLRSTGLDIQVCDIMSLAQENLSSGFPTRSNTNWAVKIQKMARGLKLWIQKVIGLYYLCSENLG